jgi:hypothetical protein
MRDDAAAVSAAARMLNGAIHESGAKSVAIAFGNSDGGFAPLSVVPKEGFLCRGGSTPTAQAMQAAHQWLEQENAKRGMVIVITDGMPTDGYPNGPTAAAMAFEELRNNGYYVLDVLLGDRSKNIDVSVIRAMCHDWAYVKDASDLVRELEAPLGNFIIGAF